MKTLALIMLLTLSSLASPQDLFTHLDDGFFAYRGHKIHFNRHGTKLLKELFAHGGPESDVEIGRAMQWLSTQARDRVERLIANVNHRALVSTGATLLLHAPRFKKQPVINRVQFDLQPIQDYRKAGARLQELIDAQRSQGWTELLLKLEDYQAVGLPLETLKRDINSRLKGAAVFHQLTIEILGTTHRATLDSATGRFGEFTPRFPLVDCNYSLR